MSFVKTMASEWTTYRTRFLITAKQLDAPLTFVDAIGREHCGQKGDYLVCSSDGTRRIAPREIFEDIYVPMGRASDPWPSLANSRAHESPAPVPIRRRSTGGACIA
jgi:hypothetical protein